VIGNGLKFTTDVRLHGMSADAASHSPDAIIGAPTGASDVMPPAIADASTGGSPAVAARSDSTSSPAAPPTSPPGESRKRTRKRVIIGSAMLVLVLAGAGVTMFVLSRRAPSWWSPSDPTSPRVIERAQAIENGAATQLTKIRQSESGADAKASAPWTVSISESDANAWLAARLPKWLESQAADAESSGKKPFKWPKELGQLQVRFADGAIWMGASVQPKSLGAPPQIFSASIDAVLRDDGSLWLPARFVSMGRLNLPASWMLSGTSNARKPLRIADVPGNLRDLPQTKDVLNILTGQTPALRRPIIRIGDGRRVKLLAIESRDGVLLITCQTLARDKKTASAVGESRP
jgi:hypothetical protein